MTDIGVNVTNKSLPINGLADTPEITIRRLDTGAVAAGPVAMVDVGADGLHRFTFAELVDVFYGFLVDADPLVTGQVKKQERFLNGGFMTSSASGLTAQDVRDAMKLAASAGAPAVDSIDDKLDDLETQIGALNDITVAQILAAVLASGDSVDAALSRLDNIDVSVTTTIPALIAALNDITVAEILAAVLASGDTVDAALSRLDNIDVSVATTIPALIAALNDLSIADVQTALTNQGLTVARAANLDNLDASVSSRASQASVDVIDAIVDAILLDTDSLVAALIADELAAVAGGSVTEIRTNATQADGFYNDMIIVVINAAGSAARPITTYLNLNGAFTVPALPFVPAATDPVFVLSAVAAATGAGLTAQQVRDAMKLAPSAGVPGAGSVDEHLDDINADTAIIEPLVSTNLDATVSSRSTVAGILAATLLSGESVDAALSRLDNIDADVATNIPASIAALNDITVAQILAAVLLSGESVDIALSRLDNIDVDVATNIPALIAALNDITVAEILAAVLISGESVDVALSRLDNIDASVTTTIPALIAALNDLSIADVQTALTNQGYTVARAANLDNLDAAVSTRATVTAILAATLLSGESLDVALSRLDNIDADVADLVRALIALETTAIAGGSTTEIRTNATQADGFFDDAIVVVVNAAGVAARRVSLYLNLNGAFSVPALPFTPAAADPVFVLTDASGAGSSITPQAVRDAMKLTPTAGAPGAGSVDEHLDDILVDTGTNIPAQIAALNNISIADILTAALVSGDTVDSALSRLDNIDADVATNIPASIAALNDITVAQILAAILASGESVDVALSRLDNIDASVATTIPALIAALNDISVADILTAVLVGGDTVDEALSRLDNIDASVVNLVSALIADILIAGAGGSPTEIRTNATQADGFYQDMTIVVVNAAGVVARDITAYLNLNGAFTVAPMPFTPGAADPVFVINSFETLVGAGLTAQAVRDAMKLSPTVGAPGAGSVDEHLDDINTDTGIIEPIVSANLDAAVSSRATPADVAASELVITNAIAALQDISIADVQTALTNQGYTVARATNLDNLDAAISSRATVAAILSAVLGSGESVDVALSRLDNIDASVATTIPALIAALNDISIADVQTALTNQGYTVARATLLDNLDATISSVALAVAALNDISVADILGATLASGNTVDDELSAILLLRDFLEGGRDIDFVGNDALGWQRIERDTGGALIRRYNLFDDLGARINITVPAFLASQRMIASEVAI